LIHRSALILYHIYGLKSRGKFWAGKDRYFLMKKKGRYILRASFTDKNGVKHYARDYGKKAFKIYI